MEIFSKTFIGAAIGAVAGIVVYLLGEIFDFLSCLCSCGSNSSMMGDGAFGKIMLVCTIGGAVIGLIYGIVREKEEADERAAKKRAADSEEAKKQRAKWADDVRKLALNTSNTCENNKTYNKPLVSTPYLASSKMKEITKELTNIAELQGKVASIVNEIEKKAGAQ